MVVHLQSFPSLHSSSHLLHPNPIPVSLIIVGNYTTAKLGFGNGLVCGGYSELRRKRGRNFQVSRASDRDSDPFEIDQAKAREALRLFDEELKSYKEKQIPAPKIKASSMESTGRDQVTDPADDILSGPFLGYLTFVLLLFTIFYNVFYFTVLEPTNVGKAPPTTEASQRVPLMEF